MRTAKVIVLPYNAAWDSAFEEIKHEIEAAIGDLIVDIEHVGSTSVDVMSAKPCIDIFGLSTSITTSPLPAMPLPQITTSSSRSKRMLA